VVTLLLPYSPINGLLGFTPLPLTFLVLLAGIVALYVLAAELVAVLPARAMVMRRMLEDCQQAPSR
jgi:hypothetical protein